ncbi:hypothetical protein R6Z07F_011654 [Ovis aries]
MEWRRPSGFAAQKQQRYRRQLRAQPLPGPAGGTRTRCPRSRAELRGAARGALGRWRPGSRPKARRPAPRLPPAGPRSPASAVPGSQPRQSPYCWRVSSLEPLTALDGEGTLPGSGAHQLPPPLFPALAQEVIKIVEHPSDSGITPSLDSQPASPGKEGDPRTVRIPGPPARAHGEQLRSPESPGPAARAELRPAKVALWSLRNATRVDAAATFCSRIWLRAGRALETTKTASSVAFRMSESRKPLGASRSSASPDAPEPSSPPGRRRDPGGGAAGRCFFEPQFPHLCNGAICS